MLTPQEVSTHAFTKAVMGGYNMAMVDEFLDELTDDYTALFKENAALKAKMKVLGVKPETIEQYTEVSEQCALEMARGVRALSGASVGVSTTGYAGPTGGTEEHPVGTVFIGLSWEGGETVFCPERRPTRSREQVRRAAASHALDLVRKEVLK
jgi:PncC family amidohydrolase